MAWLRCFRGIDNLTVMLIPAEHAVTVGNGKTHIVQKFFRDHQETIGTIRGLPSGACRRHG